MNRRNQRGFTLTELAIVLAVVGVLTAGLYNLMSGANDQVRDQSAANQHAQLIAAVKAFLGSTQGQNYMVANTVAGGCGGACAANATFALPLPTTTATPCLNPSGDTNWPAFCTFLPPGFITATTNAYGQTYAIQILRDNTPPGRAPDTYSFMIKTTGGTTVPDTSGARIASLMGGDGGFIYTNTVCGAPPASMACGSFGGWSANVVNYGFGAGASGTVASRSYISPQQNSFYSWLARVNISGDSTHSLNSMTVPEYIGGTADSYANELNMGAFNVVMLPTGGSTLNLQSGVINFGYGPPIAVPATTGTMNVQKGTIDLGGGTIKDAILFDSAIPIQLSASGASTQPLLDLTIDGTTLTENSAIAIKTGCTAEVGAAHASGLPEVGGCIAGLQVSGDAIVLGELRANSLYAYTFIYRSSDLRLKNNIKPINDALNNLMQLKPVSFNLRVNGQRGLGFVAQDIEKVYPEIVSQSKNGMKAVDYEALIAPLVDAVQVLKHENDELRTQLREQQKRQDRLEKKLDATP